MTVLEMDAASSPPRLKAMFDIIAGNAGLLRGPRGPISLCSSSRSGGAHRGPGFPSEIRRNPAPTAYQFIVLSVAKATRAAFEWSDHVRHALAAGPPQPVVDAIANRFERQPSPSPSTCSRAILAKTMAWKPVPDALQSRAATESGKEGLVEIVVLSRFYQMFAAINQRFDSGPPPTLRRKRAAEASARRFMLR